jgi:hypothetical protein
MPVHPRLAQALTFYGVVLALSMLVRYFGVLR